MGFHLGDVQPVPDVTVQVATPPLKDSVWDTVTGEMDWLDWESTKLMLLTTKPFATWSLEGIGTI